MYIYVYISWVTKCKRGRGRGRGGRGRGRGQGRGAGRRGTKRPCPSDVVSNAVDGPPTVAVVLKEQMLSHYEEYRDIVLQIPEVFWPRVLPKGRKSWSVTGQCGSRLVFRLDVKTVHMCKSCAHGDSLEKPHTLSFQKFPSAALACVLAAAKVCDGKCGMGTWNHTNWEV